MNKEHLRFKRVARGVDSVGAVVEGVAIRVDGKFWRRTATIVATPDSSNGTDQPQKTGPNLSLEGFSRKGIAEQLAKGIGREYGVGNKLEKGVFELVKDTGKTLEAQGLLEDGRVILVGRDRVESDSIDTVRLTMGGALRVARRRLQPDGAGGLSFAKKKNK